jgi:putative hemolysin
VSNIGRDIAIVLAFVLIGGFFAAAEMALVSLREGQVRAIAQRGKRGQRAARLAQDPNRFLSSVQIGVTTATLLSGAFGAATLAAELRGLLRRSGLPAGLASTLSLVAVTVVISYFSLVLGELAPKRLALQRPEPIALAAAPVLDRISVLARPLVWLLSRSVDLVVRILGGNPRAGRDAISSEELLDMVTANTDLGADERHIVGEVFEAGKRQLREVLLPRTEVEFIDSEMPIYRAAKIAAASTHSRFPVYRDSYDNVIGFVHLRDLLNPELASRATPVGELRRPVKYLPQSKTVLAALTEMRNDRSHLAIVIDEYGGTAGIVTLEDLVEELIGDIRDEYDAEAEQAKRLHGGEVEVDGLLNLDDFADETGFALPEGPYETVAGYVMAALGKVPAPGDSVEVTGHRLTVTEMDGRRVARIRVAPIPGDQPDQAPAEQRAGEAGDRPAPAEIGRLPLADTGRADGTDGTDGAAGADGTDGTDGAAGAAGGQAPAEDRGWGLEAGGRADAQDDSATTEGSDGRPEDGRATS